MCTTRSRRDVLQPSLDCPSAMRRGQFGCGNLRRDAASRSVIELGVVWLNSNSVYCGIYKFDTPAPRQFAFCMKPAKNWTPYDIPNSSAVASLTTCTLQRKPKILLPKQQNVQHNKNEHIIFCIVFVVVGAKVGGLVARCPDFMFLLNFVERW